MWASVDETTDCEGRYIANLIIGPLNKDFAGRSYLIHCAHPEQTNTKTIARTLTQVFEVLWPERIQYVRVFLLVTNSAAYIEKAARDMRILYIRMIHMTCLCHALH